MFENLELMISVLAWVVGIAAVVFYKRRMDRRGPDAWTALQIFQSHMEPDKAEIFQASQEEKQKRTKTEIHQRSENNLCKKNPTRPHTNPTQSSAPPDIQKIPPGI